MKALILCAGKGERLLPLTATIPKPMVQIAGKPLLSYNLQLCRKYGINEIAINTSHLPEKIKSFFKDGSEFGVNLHYSHEPELLGTSGALNNFRDFFTEDFLVIYGDNLTDLNLESLISFHKEKKSLATLALRRKPKEYETQSLIFADNDMRISKFIEKPSPEQVEAVSSEFKLINSGIYVLSNKILDYIPAGFSDFAYNIFPSLISANHPIHGFIMDSCYFREVGKMEKYKRARQEIESGEIKLNL